MRCATIDKGATYDAKRGGLEGAVDIAILQAPPHVIHAQLSAAATAISASGRYCVDVMGVGIDCDMDKYPHVDGKLSGVYPAGRRTCGTMPSNVAFTTC